MREMLHDAGAIVALALAGGTLIAIGAIIHSLLH